MAWNNTENVVKKNGKCWNRGMHKYCSYWKAMHSRDERKVTVGFRCNLFNKDKDGYASLPECNDRFGKTFDGKKDGTTTL